MRDAETPCGGLRGLAPAGLDGHDLVGRQQVQDTQALSQLPVRISADGRPITLGAYGAIRRSVEYSASHDFASSLAFEADMMALTGATEDHRHAVDSFVAKEKPVFEGR